MNKLVSPRGQKKQQQILEAAQRLFLEHGYDNVSMDAITAAAGISKQTLYRYYPQKAVLFAAVLEQYIEIYFQHWQLPPGDFPALDNRTAVYQVLLKLSQELVMTMMQPEYLALLRVMIAESGRIPQLAAIFRSHVLEQSIAVLAGLLRRAREQGGITGINEEAAARMFIGALLTYTLPNGFFPLREKPELPTKEQLQLLVNTFVDALTHPNEQ